MKFFRTFLLLTAGVLLAAGAACSSSDDEDSGGEEPAATTAPGGGGESNTVTIEGKDFSFVPPDFSVAPGEEVTITLNNTGNAPHTLTVYTDEDFTTPVDGADTGTVDGGNSGEFKATFEAGEYHFRCEFHPGQMTGEFDAE